MKLIHGEEIEHLATLSRAKKAGVEYIRSGDLNRNPYLRENFEYALERNILKAKEVAGEQESGYAITWMK